MYTVDELFASTYSCDSVRAWLHEQRRCGISTHDVGPGITRLTPVGIAALTMAGGQMGSTIIKIPANTLVQLLSAEP